MRLLPSPASTNEPVPETALAIAAHPDDVEFGCGATLAKWAASGCTVSRVICTDGSKGTWDERVNSAELVKRREREQRTAAGIVGGGGVIAFLGWPDGELEPCRELRSQVAYWIRRTCPQVVLSHDPWRRYRLQGDHRAAGFATIDGLVAAMDHLFFPEHDIPPHRPVVLLLWEPDEPDHVEDATARAQTKVDALLAHRSQYQNSFGIVGDSTTDDFARRVLARMAADAEGLPFRYAEWFKRIDLTAPYDGPLMWPYTG